MSNHLDKICKICDKRPVHGYVQGTGEYLQDTCLPCNRNPKNRDNYIEGGDSKRKTHTGSTQGRE